MIGLIFGDTNFPKYIYKKIKGYKKYIIIDLTKKKIFKKDKNSYAVSIGQFGKIISILKKNNCKRILFAGKVQKPNFLKIKLDLKGVYYISRIIKKSKIGDAALLKEIIRIFKKEKIKTVSSTSLTPELNLSKGHYSKYRPDRVDKKDIKNAIKKLNKIKKIKNICRGVLVKFPKKKQDPRVDLPTVGLDTLKQCKAVGLKGIVLKHNKNIFLDRIKSIKFANKNKMFILVK